MSWDPARQRVLVTGASSGIGALTARLLAARGATLGLCARRADRLSETLEACRASSPESRQWIVDLADLDAVDEFASSVLADWGGVDVLVNNAGASRRRAMDKITREEWNETFAVNFWSAVRLVEAFLPGMLARGHGRICNISSMGTRMLARNVGAYAAAKSALNTYTEALYIDLVGTGVHAQLFIPGTTATEFSVPKPGNDPPARQDPTQIMAPDEVAAALVAFLGTDDVEQFASAAHARTSAKKYADHNAWLLAMAQHFRAPP